MKATTIEECIELTIPDRLISSDLTTFLDRDDVGWRIEIEDGIWVDIPRNSRITVITKAYYKENYNLDFGSGYRVLIGIGDVSVHEVTGMVRSTHGFALMYYSAIPRLITIDFSARAM